MTPTGSPAWTAIPYRYVKPVQPARDEVITAAAIQDHQQPVAPERGGEHDTAAAGRDHARRRAAPDRIGRSPARLRCLAPARGRRAGHRRAQIARAPPARQAALPAGPASAPAGGAPRAAASGVRCCSARAASARALRLGRRRSASIWAMTPRRVSARAACRGRRAAAASASVLAPARRSRLGGGDLPVELRRLGRLRGLGRRELGALRLHRPAAPPRRRPARGAAPPPAARSRARSPAARARRANASLGACGDREQGLGRVERARSINGSSGARSSARACEPRAPPPAAGARARPSGRRLRRWRPRPRAAARRRRPARSRAAVLPRGASARPAASFWRRVAAARARSASSICWRAASGAGGVRKALRPHRPQQAPARAEEDRLLRQRAPHRGGAASAPVISFGCGSPISASIVGAMSASRPSSSALRPGARTGYRHRVGGVRGMRAAGLRIAHHLAIAVIGGDQQGAALLLRSRPRCGRDRYPPSPPP